MSPPSKSRGIPTCLDAIALAGRPALTPLAYRVVEAYTHLGNRGCGWTRAGHARDTRATRAGAHEQAMSKPTDLVQGTLDLLILKMLHLQPMNGWAIGQRLKQLSSDVLQVSDGSLYPALHKLEQEGWITAEWKPSENNRRAKFYSLTKLGRGQLEKETANWTRLSDAITQVVRIEEA
jgi:PadR family transcriptional regulator, regulatory protein PadR